MKKYGIILADNGSAWFISGAPDERYDNNELSELHSVIGANLEAVDVSLLMIDPNSGQSRPQGSDYNGDGDVDGSDLAEYAKRTQLGTAILTMELLALNFGENTDPPS